MSNKSYISKKRKEVENLVKRGEAKEEQIKRAIRNDTREKYIKQLYGIRDKLIKLHKESNAYFPFNTPKKYNNTNSISEPKPKLSKLNNVNIQSIANAKFPFNTPKRQLHFVNANNASSTPSSPVRKLKSPKKSPSPKKIPSPKKSPAKDNINRMVNSFIRNKK